eukprot:2958857-Amphidinium_carterae.3
MKKLVSEVCFASAYTVDSSSANASTREFDASYASLDSGATHVILNLSRLTAQGQREGRAIGIGLAAGKQVGELHQGEIFLRGVKITCPPRL